MRYFYHKALQRYGKEAVEPSDYRHRGHKPETKEHTILMLADAVEGASRALALHEEPTPDRIRRLIDSVVGEKEADGQLDESALNFGELKRVKEALAEALIAHYHQRVLYPGFPGSPVGQPQELAPGLPELPAAEAPERRPRP